MAEAKEDWKRGSFWITPGLIVGLATLTYVALDDVRDDLSVQILQTETRLNTRIDSLEEDLDDTRDDLSAQILQTEARLNTRIGSLKEDVVENRDKIDALETKVDRILGHLTGPEDGNGK